MAFLVLRNKPSNSGFCWNFAVWAAINTSFLIFSKFGSIGIDLSRICSSLCFPDALPAAFANTKSSEILDLESKQTDLKVPIEKKELIFFRS